MTLTYIAKYVPVDGEDFEIGDLLTFKGGFASIVTSLNPLKLSAPHLSGQITEERPEWFLEKFKSIQ